MFETVKRAIVVVAHPDDMETVLGGTVARLAERGVELMEVMCTNGDIGASAPPPDMTRVSLSALRQQETLAAAAALGCHTVEFLDRPDGELVPDLELRAEIARCYREFQADTLFTFDPWWHGQAHPDHTAAGRAAIDAYMPSKMPFYRPEQLHHGVQTSQIKQVYLFGGSERADLVVDITPYWDQKIRAVLLHKSQFSEPERAIEWLSGWGREVGARIGATYAEAFAEMRVW